MIRSHKDQQRSRNVRRYNIYEHIAVELHSHRRNYFTYFDNEFDRMDTGTPGAELPTVEMHVVDELPEAVTGDVRRTVRFTRLFTYSYVIRALDADTTKIFFRAHPLDRIYINAVAVFLQCQLLEPVMYLKLLEHDTLLMHAAGASFGDGGVLMPAHGGTGKTTTSLRLVSEGFKLLGDDLLLIDVDTNTVHPYPRPFHLFTYNINSLRGAKVPPKIRAAIRAKDAIRVVLSTLTRQEFLISTRVHADELYTGDLFSGPVDGRSIMFLRKEGATESVDLTDVETRLAVADDIAESADLNDSLFDNIVEDPDERLRVTDLERTVTSRLLEHYPTMDYVNMRAISEPDLMDRISLLKERLR